ncbi:unnamed protein product [Symbiodinium necroappetens]|uniref:Uncharacterized protein n=1 Tax=Symbiodinium necroappetens TaxID=1628268 RepID=A0A813C186_9DINO|nr:unnamed protein product [Symbiodinium necroappetens]
MVSKKCFVRIVSFILFSAGICIWSTKLMMIGAMGAVMSQTATGPVLAAFVVIPPLGLLVAVMDAVSGRSSGGIYMTPLDILWPATVVATPLLGLFFAMAMVPAPQANANQEVLQLQARAAMLQV